MQIINYTQQNMSPIEAQRYIDSSSVSNKSTPEAILESIKEEYLKSQRDFPDNKAISELTGKGMFLNVLA